MTSKEDKRSRKKRQFKRTDKKCQKKNTKEGDNIKTQAM